MDQVQPNAGPTLLVARSASFIVRQGVRRLLILALVAELSLAAWYRTSSLGGLPTFNADEAFYGIQARRLARGQPMFLHTVTGNIADPFLILPQVPFHWFFGPETWIPVLPVAISGIAAAGLAFVLFRRVLDPTTALAAAVLHATLPAAILFARTGCEFGQTPLLGVVALYFALRGRFVWLTIACVAAFLVHPTNVFLGLTLGPLVLLRFGVPSTSSTSSARVRLWALGGLALGTIGVGTWLISRPSVRAVVAQGLANADTADWSLFLDNFTIMMAQGPPLPGGFGTRTYLWACMFVGLTGVGLAVFTNRRQWDRIALVVGLWLGLVALMLLGGTHVLLGASRYGAVLITPAIVVAACLIRGLIPGPKGIEDRFGIAHLTTILVLGGLALSAANRNFFGLGSSYSDESIWTFGVEDPGPTGRTLAVLRHDRGGPSRPGKRLVLAQDYFVAMPLIYKLDGDPNFEVVQLVSIPDLGAFILGQDPIAPRLPRIAERLEAGDFAIRADSAAPSAGTFLDRLIAERFDSNRVHTWSIPGGGDMRIYRVEPSPQAVQIARRPVRDAGEVVPTRLR